MIEDFAHTDGVSIHTGFPNPGTDTRLKSLDLNNLLVHNSASTFIMRIAGHEWQASGLFDGDIAIIDRALLALPNDIVIWWKDGDFAISSCQRMRPDATIWGVVTATVHQFYTPQGKRYE